MTIVAVALASCHRQQDATREKPHIAAASLEAYAMTCGDMSQTTIGLGSCDVSFSQLAARPELFNGKRISLRGVLAVRANGDVRDPLALYPNCDSFRMRDVVSAVTVLVNDENQVGQFAIGGIGPVDIYGKFEAIGSDYSNAREDRSGRYLGSITADQPLIVQRTPLQQRLHALADGQGPGSGRVLRLVTEPEQTTDPARAIGITCEEGARHSAKLPERRESVD